MDGQTDRQVDGCLGCEAQRCIRAQLVGRSQVLGTGKDMGASGRVAEPGQTQP